MNVNDFDCHALCDLGTSISIMPRKINDMLGLPPHENCYFDVPLADVAKKKPLGRPFLRTVCAILDMKEGTIKYQFPLKKGMEHFPRKRKKLLFDSILRVNYELDASSLEIT
jgi:hypothetical protein